MERNSFSYCTILFSVSVPGVLRVMCVPFACILRRKSETPRLRSSRNMEQKQGQEPQTVVRVHGAGLSEANGLYRRRFANTTLTVFAHADGGCELSQRRPLCASVETKSPNCSADVWTRLD
eukprot:4221621-Prymnesium_polylepis.3